LLKPSIVKFLWVAGPKVLAGGLQFGLTIVLMRHFSPKEFGIISVCLSAVILCDSIVGGATDSGVLRLAPSSLAVEGQRSLEFQQAGVILKLLFVALIAMPLLLFARPLSDLLFQNTTGARYLCISLVALLATLLMRSAQMQYQVTEQFVLYGAADLTNSLLKFGGIGLLLALAHPSPGTVLAAYGISTTVVAALIFGSTGSGLLRTHLQMVRLRELISHVRWFVVVSATGTVIGRMDLFLVSSLSGVSTAGIYSAAQVIALVPQLIGSYIAVVFSPRIMPMWEQGTLPKLFKDVQLGIACCAVLIYMATFALLPRVSGVLFPQAFQRSVPVILALLPSGLCALINFPLTLLLLLFLRPRLLVALDCISLPFLLVAYLWAIRNYGVMGAATVTTAAALLKTAFMQIAAWRLLRSQSQAPATTPISLLTH
jgi:O-antigen/teichoic acid export membrane protein